tara:strand:- start:718 stop:1308 length:591 start_codon:yes stop_codon:yes gene_type:complete
MRIELILLVVIVTVVVIDIVLRSLKKKSSNDKDIIRENKFNYILNRKRNIIIFLLLTAMLKPIIHYVFSEEKSNVFESKKIDLGSVYSFHDYNLKDSIGNLYRVLRRDSYSFVDFQSGKQQKSIDSDYKQNGIFTSNGDQLYKDMKGGKLFMYRLKNISFNEYLNQKFLLKPYIFIISFGIMLLFVLLFNDKIKAR